MLSCSQIICMLTIPSIYLYIIYVNSRNGTFSVNRYAPLSLAGSLNVFHNSTFNWNSYCEILSSGSLHANALLPTYSSYAYTHDIRSGTLTYLFYSLTHSLTHSTPHIHLYPSAHTHTHAHAHAQYHSLHAALIVLIVYFVCFICVGH
jgi:hypothetical protein